MDKAKFQIRNKGGLEGFVFLPPALTTAAFAWLLSQLGQGGLTDAQTWPLLLHSSVDPRAIDNGIGIYRAFVFSAALLVVLNNVCLYLADVKRASEEADPTAAGGRSARNMAFWFAILSTAWVVFWLADTVLSIIPAEAASGAKHEIYGFVAFLVFAIIDLSLGENAKQRLAVRTTDAHLQAKADYYHGQAVYTDFPVVIGMIVIFLVARGLQVVHAFNSSFEHGFFAGAVGMHLAYSQFVFLALTFKYRKNLSQQRAVR